MDPNYGYVPQRTRRRSSVSDLRASSNSGMDLRYPPLPGPAGFDMAATSFRSRPLTAPTAPGIDPMLTSPSLSSGRGGYFDLAPLAGSTPRLSSQEGGFPSARPRTARWRQPTVPVDPNLQNMAFSVESRDPIQYNGPTDPPIYAPSALPPMGALGQGSQYGPADPGTRPSDLSLAGTVLPPMPAVDESYQWYGSQIQASGVEHPAGLPGSVSWQTSGLSGPHVAPTSLLSSYGSYASGTQPANMARSASDPVRSGYAMRSRRSSIDLRRPGTGGSLLEGGSFGSQSPSGASTPGFRQRYGTVTRQNMQGLMSEPFIERSWPGEWGDAFR